MWSIMNTSRLVNKDQQNIISTNFLTDQINQLEQLQYKAQQFNKSIAKMLRNQAKLQDQNYPQKEKIILILNFTIIEIQDSLCTLKHFILQNQQKYKACIKIRRQEIRTDHQFFRKVQQNYNSKGKQLNNQILNIENKIEKAQSYQLQTLFFSEINVIQNNSYKLQKQKSLTLFTKELKLILDCFLKIENTVQELILKKSIRKTNNQEKQVFIPLDISTNIKQKYLTNCHFLSLIKQMYFQISKLINRKLISLKTKFYQNRIIISKIRQELTQIRKDQQLNQITLEIKNGRLKGNKNICISYLRSLNGRLKRRLQDSDNFKKLKKKSYSCTQKINKYQIQETKQQDKNKLLNQIDVASFSLKLNYLISDVLADIQI